MNPLTFVLAFCLTLNGGFVFPEYRSDAQEVQYMDRIALENDPSKRSGKGSNWHFYTKVYPLYFSHLKEQPIKFLEIGIYHGDGVKLWEAYFPHADLHFIDITFANVEYFSERSHYHLADQSNEIDLIRVMEVSGGGFDIIMDDGGHTMEQQLVSFQTLFPYLKSGGLYIIEDLHTSYWREYGGGGAVGSPKSGPGTFVDYLKGLIDDVNFVGVRTRSADHNKMSPEIESALTTYQKDIYSMHFYDSLCVIIKR